MQINHITPDYAVSPQVAPTDFAQIAQAGFKTVICNRPDGENPADLHICEMKAAAKAQGLVFLENPFPSPAMTMDHVTAQADLLDNAQTPVFAYCASGTRCSVVWSMVMAGKMSTDEILQAVRGAGYMLDGLRPQIDALARTRDA
ncbi:TIGR01244 family sulfur transferase [Algirhabdus cladophorae]|uniref:TIGR01244 family sulfur transferase n=1 Tax=Algirhabdus cladophorae TaxID=3377108 RepID=UPI003B84AF35